MTLAVITPTTGDEEALKRCSASVREAAAWVPAELLPVLHVVVGDGAALASCLEGDARYRPEFMWTPARAGDAGATPRAIGSTYALSRGVEGVYFLDDDNTIDPTHLKDALDFALRGNVVVTSLRKLVHPDGRVIRVDESDSDGLAFADTNTVALFGDARPFGTTWSWFAQESGTDRIFWDRVRHSFMGRIACTERPTVNYVTRWAVHYNGTDIEPPNPAKFVTLRPDGTRGALLAEPVHNGVEWIPGAQLGMPGRTVKPFDQKVVSLP